MMAASVEGTCPFFRRYAFCRDGGAKIYCDCATVRCPNSDYRRKMLYGYCAHPSDWQQCQFFRLMESYYAGELGEKNPEHRPERQRGRKRTVRHARDA